MTRKTWVLVLASVFVSVILLEGQVFATDADDLKKIVVFQDGISLDVLQKVLALNGITVTHTLSFINALAITLPASNAAQALAFLLNYKLPQTNTLAVVGIYDDLMFSVLPITPALPWEVPLIESYDWGLARIGVDVAHQERPKLTGAGVKVAVVDTGVGPHLDLPMIVEGFNALPGGVLFYDDHGHGTHMAGIIAARINGLGIMGAAPLASIVAVKVLDAGGQGYLSDLLNGLQWIYNNQIQKQIWLVNMSLGFSADSVPLQRAIKLLYDRGTLMVASAGNSCSDSPDQDEDAGADGEGPTCDTPQTTTVKYPARYPWVLAVAATDYANQIAAYSLAGAEVDIAAPGGIHTGARILSTYLAGWYGHGSGTSQAAAHVTGALALLRQQLPQLSLNQVRMLLQHTAMDLGYPATQQGWGLIAVEPLLAAPQ
jgi:subtilisin family serine protease